MTPTPPTVTLPAQTMTVEALEALIAEAKAKQPSPFVPKVGQRVRFLEDNYGDPSWGRKGEEGTVVRASAVSSDVRLDNRRGTWAAANRFLEPAEPQPVEDQEYRNSRVSDTDAVENGDLYRFHNGVWQFNYSCGTARLWVAPCNGAKHWRDGLLVPYTPPAPKPQPIPNQEYRRREESDASVADSGNVYRYHTGQWQFNMARGTERRWISFTRGSRLWPDGQLVPYTPPATHITPCYAKLLKCKADGQVLRLWEPCEDTTERTWWVDPVDSNQWAFRLAESAMTTLDYEVLDSYLLKGAK